MNNLIQNSPLNPHSDYLIGKTKIRPSKPSKFHPWPLKWSIDARRFCPLKIVHIGVPTNLLFRNGWTLCTTFFYGRWPYHRALFLVLTTSICSNLRSSILVATDLTVFFPMEFSGLKLDLFCLNQRRSLEVRKTKSSEKEDRMNPRLILQKFFNFNL